MRTKKKLGIDARMISHSGIGVRILSLLKCLHDNLPEDLEVYLFGDKEKLGSFSKFKIIPYETPIYSIKELFGHKLMSDMDVLDIPHFNFPIPYIRKSLVTIHDLTPYKMKDLFPELSKRVYLNIMFRILRLAKKIVTVSNHTLSDLKNEFSIPEKKLIRIYNGVDKKIFYKRSSKEVNSFKEKYKLPNEFILMIGIGKAHKNFSFALDGLLDIWESKKINTPLVLAGTGGKIPEFLKDSFEKAKEKIFLLPYLEQAELPVLYSSSKALVFPSLYEGFGFPLVEAASCECLVISSNASVMPEIMDEAAIYFDPLEKESFQDAILQGLTQDHSKLIKLGLENSKRFDWTEATTKQIELYRA
ncbi:MAG: glycosyltransferase family 1 protein [Leptospiraceae bacterium]|nr:glycosyltransferase family 1 protein [Leptospiraceae bacterium]